MPKIALGKVAKKIRKKKGALDTLGDRDAARYNRASLRDLKLKKHAKLRGCAKSGDMIRTGYFKVETKHVKAPLTTEEARALIDKWVRRDDEELVRYEAGRRPGRAAIPKHADLKNRVEKEREEFRTGFLIPDVYDLDNIVNLQLWDGTVGSLAQVNFIHVSKEDTAEEVVEDKMEI